MQDVPFLSTRKISNSHCHDKVWIMHVIIHLYKKEILQLVWNGLIN